MTFIREEDARVLPSFNRRLRQTIEELATRRALENATRDELLGFARAALIDRKSPAEAFAQWLAPNGESGK